jgi:flagellin
MGSILTNLSASAASRQLGLTGTQLSNTIQRLTTGKRINTASDDAAGLAIANKLGADIKISTQAQRNANDGVSYMQVADGALDEVTQLLTRGAQLAQQAQTGTISDANRLDLDAEFQNIVTTLVNIGHHTNFNGQAIFSTSAQPLFVAVGDYGVLTLTMQSMSSSNTNALGLTMVTSNLQKTDSASAVAAIIATALASVSDMRASIGASEQQLNATSSILGIQVQNFTAAQSQIQDANISEEVVNLTKFQILNQSGTAALSKSNQSAQQVLALLQ